ncbi:FAS1-like dehydratase domain-containing protein [Actinomycetospora straminea]|uniref:MaoC family dehydratase N-terminal domain-containing protein n=1 Tax=Actinomycetospora straminea TaxID=663607 RepID=A0ABP9EJ76_9PSEU|nr:MaoC family dehydratase N-terminal domain-containing protein [Actinomycetospora straminea]MDD7933801.1 MaoC family dehydratase N-terminal domain-containing protein [Actinomycetospora straminea]
MSETTTRELADLLEDWAPPEVSTARSIDPWPAAAFADLLDAEPPDLEEGAPLPPLWHWFTLLEHRASSDIGEDGHPVEGPFLPPLPRRRRMFAGGRLWSSGPLPVGAELRCRERVSDVAVKSGRSGASAFVTVRRELTVDGRDVAVEEQDVVYRSETPGRTRPSIGRPLADGTELPGPWRRGLEPDPVLLARFSALTYNGHRIHYDHPYTTGVEGYPDLVVHGPLLALLALELPRTCAPDAVVAEFSYRLVRPAFLPTPLVAAGAPDGDGASLAVGARDCPPSLTATARFR